MAVVGLTMVRIAMVDENQQLIKGKDGLSDSGIYEIDYQDLGTKTANISNLEGSTEKVWGNNQMQDLMVGAASPQVALDINDLNFVMRQKVLGNLPDGKGGYVYCGKKPRIALSVESRSIQTQKAIFFNFGNGTMTMPNQNVATDTEKQTRENDALTYTALSTKAFNDEPIKIYYEGDSDYDKPTMLKETFGGYVETTPPSGTQSSVQKGGHK